MWRLSHICRGMLEPLNLFSGLTYTHVIASGAHRYCVVACIFVHESSVTHDLYGLRQRVQGRVLVFSPIPFV